jgi:hypothetical protein
MLENKLFNIHLTKKIIILGWYDFRKISFGFGSEYSWKGFVYKVKSIFFVDFLFFRFSLIYFGKGEK